MGTVGLGLIDSGVRGCDRVGREGFYQRSGRIPWQQEQHGANGNGMFRYW